MARGTGTRAAEEAAGVGHHVCVSVAGCDQVPVGYYRVKTDQERLVEQGPVPWTIVRATQFYELVARFSFSAWLGAGAGAAVTSRGGPESR